MSNGVAEWFGLKRPNFILDPKTDAKFYAPRTGIQPEKLIEGLQVNLVTDRPPKRFFWGLYGTGKTHTLYNVSTRLQDLTPILPIFVECPSVPKRSTFHDLYHDGIMSTIGQEFTVTLFEELLDTIRKIRYEELFSELKGIMGDEELARAGASLLGSQAEKKLAFWRYISGVSLSPRDLTDLRQTQALADAEPSKLAGIIIIIGRIVKKIKGQTMVLIIDEVDRLNSVNDEFGLSTYENAFRKLTDENQRDVAILIGASGENMRSMPDFLAREDGPILSRIGRHNVIPIPQISADDVDVFIRSIIKYVVDREKASARLQQIKHQTTEAIEIDVFPFTKEALEALKGVLRGIMTPREITQRMSDAAGKAFLMRRQIITSDIFEV